MPNIAAVLKDEIRRLARKEIRAAQGQLKRENLALKRNIATLKRRVDSLERKNKKLLKTVPVAGVAPETDEAGQTERARISAKTIRNLRGKLGLTQAEFATLLGVSGQSVYQWESKEGPLLLRSAPRAAILSVRDMGKKEARARLEELENLGRPPKKNKSRPHQSGQKPGRKPAKGKRGPGRPRKNA